MPDIQPDLLVFRVDFNNLDDQRRVKGSFAHASSDRVPQVGERVLLQDPEGNACWAVVSEKGTLTLRFELELDTWISSEVLAAAGVPALDPSTVRWSGEPAPA